MKRQLFGHSFWPYALILPQIAIIAIFFVWPAGQGAWQSMHLEDPWGLSADFVGFENYTRVFNSPTYRSAVIFTAIFSVSVAVLSMAIAMVLAV